MIQTTADTYQLPAALPLEEGGLLLNAKLAYECYGRPKTDRTVVLLHDLVQSHHAAGPTEASAYQPSGWARELVGEGKVISPRDYHIVSVNLLGSPFGSTSPASIDPETQRPLGAIFPQLTILDMARGVSGLLRGLKIPRAKAVIGFGLGGMVALRLAAIFRDVTLGVVTVGSAKALPEGLREQLSMTAQLLAAAPAGSEAADVTPDARRRTLRNLRLDYLLRAAADPTVTADSPGGLALAASADAFAQSFDPDCYALLAGALGRADLSDFLERLRARVLVVGGSFEGSAPLSKVRDTYHLLTASGVQAHFCETPPDVVTVHQVTQRLRGPISEFMSML